MIAKKRFGKGQTNFDHILKYIHTILSKNLMHGIRLKYKVKFKAFEINHPIYSDEYVYFNISNIKNNGLDVILSQHHQEVATFHFKYL